MAIKLYKLLWTDEGIMYRRGNFVILKPSKSAPGTWRLRKVHSDPGKQKDLKEADYKSEKEAFKAGNKAVRRK